MRADRFIEQSPLLRARVLGQAGLVTRAQAVAGGISIESVRWALASGRWLVLHPGVYLTTPGRDDWEVRTVAILLSVGGRVALAGPSARFAWGLERREPETARLIIPASRRAPVRAGLAVTRTRHFDERVHQTAWPHRTTVEHSVLDVERHEPADRMLALVSRACQQGLTSESRLAAALASRAGHPHGALLLECLADVGSGAESAAEIRYIRDVERAHGLPAATRQAVLGHCPALRQPVRERSSWCSRSTDVWATRAGPAGCGTASGTELRRGRVDSRCAGTGPTSPAHPAPSPTRSGVCCSCGVGEARRYRAGDVTVTCGCRPRRERRCRVHPVGFWPHRMHTTGPGQAAVSCLSWSATARAAARPARLAPIVEADGP